MLAQPALVTAISKPSRQANSVLTRNESPFQLTLQCLRYLNSGSALAPIIVANDDYYFSVAEYFREINTLTARFIF